MFKSIKFTNDGTFANNSYKQILGFGVGGGGGGSGSQDFIASSIGQHTSTPGQSAITRAFTFSPEDRDYVINIGKGGSGGSGGVKGTNGTEGTSTIFDNITFKGGEGGIFVPNTDDKTIITNHHGSGGKGGHTELHGDGECGHKGRDGCLTLILLDMPLQEELFTEHGIWTCPDEVEEIMVECGIKQADGSFNIKVELVNVIPRTNYLVYPGNHPQFGGVCTWNSDNTFVGDGCDIHNYAIFAGLLEDITCGQSYIKVVI